MKIAELIAIAKVRSGKDLKEMAEEMAIHASRLTKISKGDAQPKASEIAYIASLAKQDPLRAIAEIESEREPLFAPMWNRLLSGAKS